MRRLDWRLPKASALGACRSPPAVGNHRWHQGMREQALSGVQSIDRCARVPFWLQKSARGVGLREATPVAAGAGDGGLAHTWGTAGSEWTLRAPALGNELWSERPEEGRLLVEGAPGRGKPSAFTGRRGKRSRLTGFAGWQHRAPVRDRGVRAAALSGWQRSIAAPAPRCGRAKRVGTRETPDPPARRAWEPKRDSGARL